MQPHTPEPFSLNIRIPAWATTCTLRQNGQPITLPTTNGYARFACSGLADDHLSIEFQYRLTLRNESLAEVPFAAVTDTPTKLALFCGPYLLAADDQIDPAFVAEPLWENVLYLNSLAPATNSASRLADGRPGETYHTISYKHQGFPGFSRLRCGPCRRWRGEIVAL